MRKAHFSKIKGIILFLIAIILLNPLASIGQIQHQLKWEELPPIPDKEGFAGMFAGVSNDALICMGGANFPEKMPWEGGLKKWYDHIYILEKNATSWKLAKETLPLPLGYGVSVSYNDQIIFVGGSDNRQHYASTYSLAYKNGTIKIDTLVPLPFPLANMSGAL